MRYSLFGIFGIPERVESASPWGNLTSNGQTNETSKSKNTNGAHCPTEEKLELLLSNVRTYELSKCNKLQEPEHA